MPALKEYYRTKLGVLYKGDAMEGIKELDKKFKVIILDPPYVTLRDIRSREWTIPEMRWILRELYRLLENNGIIFYFGIPQHFLEVSETIKNLYDVWFELIWVKPNAVNFGTARIKPLTRHESIWCLIKKGTKKTEIGYNYRLVGEWGSKWLVKTRGKYDLFIDANKPYIQSSNGFRFLTTVIEAENKPAMHPQERTEHPTQKPIKLIEKLVLGWSNEGDWILDPFMGSGTTAVVAEKHRRKWVGIEIEEKWCELIKYRLENAQYVRRLSDYVQK